MDILEAQAKKLNRGHFVLVNESSFFKISKTCTKVYEGCIAHSFSVYGQLDTCLENSYPCGDRQCPPVNGLVFWNAVHFFKSATLDIYNLPPAGKWANKPLPQNEKAGLRQNMAEDQRGWDIYLQPLTYTYNAKVHQSTNLPRFSLGQSCHTPGLTIFNIPIAWPTDATAATSLQAFRARII